MTGTNTRRFALTVLLTGLVFAEGCGSRPAPTILTETPAETVSETHVIEHEVQPGETLARIADNYYGDPLKADDIARDNGITSPDRVAAGSVLALRFGPDQWEDAQRRAAALEAYNRGVDFLGQERLAEAGRQFQLALDTAPGLVAADYNLALVQMRRGKNDQALSLLDGLVARRPDDTDFGFARGTALYQLTRFDEAADQFSRVLERDPGHTRAAFALARSLQAGDHRSRAMSAWRHYLELDDSSSWAASAQRNLRKLQDGDS